MESGKNMVHFIFRNLAGVIVGVLALAPHRTDYAGCLIASAAMLISLAAGLSMQPKKGSMSLTEILKVRRVLRPIFGFSTIILMSLASVGGYATTFSVFALSLTSAIAALIEKDAWQRQRECHESDNETAAVG
jgi:hypothetical protein